MSTLNIRTLLSKSVTAIKTKLGIDSFTWGEYEDKLAEAMGGVDIAALIQNIGDAAFYECEEITTANFPAVTTIGEEAFDECPNLTTVNFPVATTIGGWAFEGCPSITTVNFPVVTSIGEGAFSFCENLTTADFGAVTSIDSKAFFNCAALIALILRNTAGVCTLSYDDFWYCYYGDNQRPCHTGYIYVPSALLSSYEAATNWSYYASKFRALEDYTVDGTTTGALDPTKTGVTS